MKDHYPDVDRLYWFELWGVLLGILAAVAVFWLVGLTVVYVQAEFSAINKQLGISCSVSFTKVSCEATAKRGGK